MLVCINGFWTFLCDINSVLAEPPGFYRLRVLAGAPL